MLTLSRTVRFAVNPPGTPRPEGRDPNGFGGSPAMRGLGRWYEIDVVCRGEPDARTGYLVDIKAIDQAVRSAGVPLIARACAEHPAREPGWLLPSLFDRIDEALPAPLWRLRWRLTPFYTLTMQQNDMQTVLLQQMFEFAAAHRLHVESMTEEENWRVFGKCNNPNAHGHNYRVQPLVAVRLGERGEQRFTLADLERLVEENVIDHFDHQNLNVDVKDFEKLVPSVEHIARVAFERLVPAIEQAAGDDARLVNVTVWETDKTASTFPAEAVPFSYTPLHTANHAVSTNV